MTDEIRYRLFQYLEQHPEASQREVARELGISVGKVNYCLRALIAKGWIKMRNFRSRKNKLGYAYFLTPRGIEEKVKLTYSFLVFKLSQYNDLTEEIERLQKEVAANDSRISGTVKG